MSDPTTLETPVQTHLHDGWTVRASGGLVPPDLTDRAFPATVPGCVHLDLMAAGVIPDPYLDENELAVAWVGHVDWRYEKVFDWDPRASDHDHVDLVAHGLDTFATIELNGSELGSVANMHRSFRFPVNELLAGGSNTLAITFAAGVEASRAASAALGELPHDSTHPFNAVRKMASSYGWDWGPELVTAGIWRPLALESWSAARIASVRPLVDVEGTTGRLRAHVDLERAGDADHDLVLKVTVDGRCEQVTVPPGALSATVEIDVPDVRLWWPHGYGEQALYPVTATLLDVGTDEATDLATWSGNVGFRTVTLDTTPDEHGTPFSIAVNGVPVFVRGVNWIPDDCFPSRVTRERYAERLGQARGANVNLIRVWGGGIYEDEAFYDLCDTLGLLVWQDFLFACAAYTEEEPLRGEVVAEAREAVTRLSAHASLAIWNGCNENIWGHEDWGWKDGIGDRTWGWGYYTDVLPSIVAELDPTRPYSPGSPYSFTEGKHPNDPAHGTTHIWDVWNQLDYSVYRDYLPRFASEFGFQGPPTWSTLTRSIHDEPLAHDSPGMLLHQKADDGDLKLTRGLEPHLPAPTSFEDWHWATTLNQARAITLGVEHFRASAPICTGSIVWQLNDCWPVTSWAAVDGDGRQKPLYYALKHSYADRLLTVQPDGDTLVLVVVNDSPDSWRGDVEVSRRDHDGSALAVHTQSYDVPARGTARLELPQDVVDSTRADREVLLAQADGVRGWWFFTEDVDAALVLPELETSLEETPDGYTLTVTTATFVRDLALLVDVAEPDAVVEDMLVTLMPGESTTFQLHTKATLTVEQLSGPLVLRSSNQLVAAAQEAHA